MPHEFEEHLLSAYLDNELSADERALVEERLKTDPGARQLLDDLKRVRSLVFTLPRWQGDAKPMLPVGQMAANSAAEPGAEEGAIENPTTENPAVAKPSESDGSTTSRRVDFSATGLAESRLRRHEHAAEVRTRRSMRWTTIVAVAATLATLMLGTPYLLRDWGPKTELAQHSDFGREPAAAESAPEPAPGAAPAESKSMAARRSAGDKSDLATGEAREQSSEKTGASADHDAYSLRQSDAETTANAYFADRGQAPSRSDSTERLARGMQTPALKSRAKTLGDNAPKRDRADASGGAALSERSEPSLSFAPSVPANEPQGAATAAAPTAPEAAAAPAARQPSRPQFRQESLNYEGVAGSGAARPAQGPAAVAPLSQSLDAGERIAAGQPRGGGATPSPAPAAPQIMTARSDAWSDAEVEAAMTRVWFFVSPGATADAAVALQAVPQQPASGMGVDNFGARADQPAGQANANYAYKAQPADEMKSAAGAAADRKLGEKPAENSVALSKAQSAGSGGIAGGGYGGSDSAARLAPGAPLPAVGLARLPADESA
ncbi:MAG: anti-sigma factor family protein, partial [Aureliella sp.]